MIFLRSFRRWALGCGVALALVHPAAAARFSAVVIDPGHGGADKGAFWGGVRESHLTLQVAQRLETLLKRKGVKTVMTRRSDHFISLPNRIAVANRQRGAVTVSIHFNACPNPAFRGTETFYWGGASLPYAVAVQKRLVQRLGTSNRGVKRKAFAILAKTRGPAVLVECGFLSHPGERARCRTAAFQSAAAQAIFEGLMAVR